MGHLHYSILGMADDITLVATSVPMLSQMVSDLYDALRVIGLKINEKKCKFMCVQSVGPNVLKIKDLIIPQRNDLKILGCIVSNDASIEPDVDEKIANGWRCFYKHFSFLKNGSLSNDDKYGVLNKCINAVFSYGCQIYTTNSAQTIRFDVCFVDMCCKVIRMQQFRHESFDDYYIRKRSCIRADLIRLGFLPSYVFGRRYWTYIGHILRSELSGIFCYRNSEFWYSQKALTPKSRVMHRKAGTQQPHIDRNAFEYQRCLGEVDITKEVWNASAHQFSAWLNKMYEFS